MGLAVRQRAGECGAGAGGSTPRADLPQRLGDKTLPNPAISPGIALIASLALGIESMARRLDSDVPSAGRKFYTLLAKPARGGRAGARQAGRRK